MDGDCALCTFGARMIARFDRRGVVRICPVQTPLGQAVLRHYGVAPGDPETWLFVDRGRAWDGMDAMLHAGWRLGGLGLLMQPLWLVPPVLRRWLYRRIARNRYALFGRRDMCAVSDARLRSRLIG